MCKYHFSFVYLHCVCDKQQESICTRAAMLKTKRQVLSLTKHRNRVSHLISHLNLKRVCILHFFISCLTLYIPWCVGEGQQMNVQALALSSNHVGPRTWTQVFLLGGKWLYSSGHLTGSHLRLFGFNCKNESWTVLIQNFLTLIFILWVKGRQRQ